MQGIGGPSLPRLTQDMRPLGCLHCGTNENVAIESIESLPPHPGELQVQVGYVCRKCQGNYLHRARFRDVAAVLNKVRSLDGAAAKAIPAVALTALVSEDQRQRAMNAGFQEFVGKPFDRAKLISILATISRKP